MSGTALLATGLAALAVAVVLVVMALAWGTTGRARMVNGLTAIETQYSRGSAPAPRAQGAELVLPPVLDRLRALAVRLSPGNTLVSLQRRLDVAGNPSRWTPERVLAYKGAGLLALASVGVLYGLGSVPALIGFTALGGTLGFFLPDVLLHNAAAKRQTAIADSMPDTLDMLTVCVEAGLGFDAALSQVARNTSGPLSTEWVRMLQEMQLGKSRVESLRALSSRTTVNALRTFASSLVQASELGIPTARVLREQAKEMRVKRRQQAEEKAQKVPVKILFPLLLCIFPSLFIIVIGPGAISMFDTMTGP